MSGTVSTRWFWADWLSDPGLRACGYAARGLWKDMLCIAGSNKGDEYGFVTLNGRPLDAAAIARMTGGALAEVESLLIELENNGVFSRDRRKVIYCRRMVRAEKNRGNGRLGGNPILLKEKKNPKSNKPMPKPLIPEPEPEPIPERKEEEPTLALSGGVAPPPDDWPSNAWDQFWNRYPHRVGKPNARKAFDKARRTKVAWAVFMVGLDCYVRKTDDRPWCNPSTWLNQQRWEDEPAQSTPKIGRGGGMAQVHRMLREGGNDAGDASS